MTTCRRGRCPVRTSRGRARDATATGRRSQQRSGRRRARLTEGRVPSIVENGPFFPVRGARSDRMFWSNRMTPLVLPLNALPELEYVPMAAETT